MIRRAKREDSGLTLVELMVVIAILGILALPLSNLGLAGFRYYARTETRLADSHALQIATAYFSQDAANTGQLDGTGNHIQSIWIAPTFPASYCGKGVGTPLALLTWNDISASLNNGATQTTVAVDSATYTVSSGVLHRIFCLGGTTTTSDVVLARNFVYPDPGTSPFVCATSSGAVVPCTTATPPPVIKLTLSIKGPTDTSVWRPQLSGLRRQG